MPLPWPKVAQVISQCHLLPGRATCHLVQLNEPLTKFLGLTPKTGGYPPADEHGTQKAVIRRQKMKLRKGRRFFAGSTFIFFCRVYLPWSFPCAFFPSLPPPPGQNKIPNCPRHMLTMAGGGGSLQGDRSCPRGRWRRTAFAPPGAPTSRVV